MKNFFSHIIVIFAAILLVACSHAKQIPVQTVINYKDSIIINKVDSVVVIPIEKVVDVVPSYDTLKLETSMAKSISYVDTSLHMLRGSIVNKKGIEYRYVYRDSIQVIDSVITKEIPIPVEVVKTVHPKYEKWLWLILFSMLTFIGVKIYSRLKYG